MKRTILGGCMAAGLLLGSIGVAQATDTVDWNALPSDETALRHLDTKQERALRQAVRHCGSLHRTQHQREACVYIDVDRVMRQSDDAALRAYHFALPRSLRYNENRNSGLAIKQVQAKRERAAN